MQNSNESMRSADERLAVQQEETRRTSVLEWLLRVIIATCLVLCIILVIIDSLHEKKVETAVLNFLAWVEENPYEGALAIVVVYIVATILFVPASILTLGAGYAFGTAFDNVTYGVFVASMAVFIGASLGSITTFLLGRYLFRPCVLRMASSYPLFRAVEKALRGNGLKIMVLLRLSPLIPYNALDYLSGVTAIPLWAYSMAMFGMVPGIVMFCYIGATASSLTEGTSEGHGKTLKIVSLVFGITFAIGGFATATYYSKLELDRILAEEGPDNAFSDHTTTENNTRTNDNAVSSYQDNSNLSSLI